MMKRILFACGLMLLGLAAAPANAQMSSAASAIETPERVIPFAKKVERELGQRGALVAIVSRMGRDPKQMPDGIGDYTHVGIWVYSEMTAADGRKVNGYAVYNLYQVAGDEGRSELKQDFPAEFFASVFDLKTGIVIPTPEVQAEILRVLNSKTYADLHVPAYSVVANPYDWQYQNCTNFVMSVLVAAIYGTDDRAEITQHLRAHYEPQTVKLSGITRAVGSIFVDGFATADHKGGPLKTSTFDSIARFLTTYGMAQAVLEVTEEGVVEKQVAL
ncbi:MAG: DUF2145 domain-containing protein [Parvibaculum sp.]|uniref:DUF2145 domain-containing protein n=1 Tax=Parvibaculum sp. TaxID=2024848 RepID=UPI002AB87D55|nr:DUF2145 domain-containing protein [Parvibaculum sp.]MDZ4380520.1 DUF2145 domain-containing protein [Parvibaculum sp.]